MGPLFPLCKFVVCDGWVFDCCGAIPVHTRVHTAPAIVSGFAALTLRPPAARYIQNNAALTTLEAGLFDGLTVGDL